MAITLRDKFRGCIMGAHHRSCDGAPQVEGWTWQKIEEQCGFVEDFTSYEHYNNGWVREPGTTEDGIERQKLMITAIMEKGDRVTAEDVRAAWIEHANPNAGGLVSEPFEVSCWRWPRRASPHAIWASTATTPGSTAFPALATSSG